MQLLSVTFPVWAYLCIFSLSVRHLTGGLKKTSGLSDEPIPMMRSEVVRQSADSLSTQQSPFFGPFFCVCVPLLSLSVQVHLQD